MPVLPITGSSQCMEPHRSGTQGWAHPSPREQCGSAGSPSRSWARGLTASQLSPAPPSQGGEHTPTGNTCGRSHPGDSSQPCQFCSAKSTRGGCIPETEPLDRDSAGRFGAPARRPRCEQGSGCAQVGHGRIASGYLPRPQLICLHEKSQTHVLVQESQGICQSTEQTCVTAQKELNASPRNWAGARAQPAAGTGRLAPFGETQR